jgi:catechol 2,3-dioxygenase-like lactoylglutathione lyase family enzyme
LIFIKAFGPARRNTPAAGNPRPWGERRGVVMAAQAEPLHDIAHLGSVELFTPKPEKSLWYFRDLLGMEPVHQSGPSVYQRGYGDYATSTLKLTAAANAGVGFVSWRATSAQALERRAKALDDAGLGLGWSNGDFGRGRSYRFRDPDGHVMGIYYEEQKFVAPASLHSTLKNLPQKYTGRGVCVRRVDHLALLAKDVEANRKFAQELLGFQLREQVRYDKGKTEIGSWMSPTAIHHQLAYVVDVKGAHGRLHHFSRGWTTATTCCAPPTSCRKTASSSKPARPSTTTRRASISIPTSRATASKSTPAASWSWRPTGSR